MAAEKKEVKVHARPGSDLSGEGTFLPAVDIYETKEGNTVMLVDMPGAAEGGVDIRVDKGVLTIEAEAVVPEFGKDYNVTFGGFTGGKYFRAFALSDEIDRDRIEASMANGVLTLRLPRAKAAQTRKIEIKQG